MAVETAGQVGPQLVSDGAVATFRQGKTAEAIIQELHGRFFEQNYRALLFSDGVGLTAINNSTYTTGTLTASCTPIIGLYNPSTSPVNLVVLQATLGLAVTAGTATGGGPFVWASSVGNTAISTGSTPLNRKTLVAAGSFAKGMCNVALTGLTNALTVKFGSALNGGLIKNISSVETAVGQNIGMGGGAAVENFDGGLIVPPGGVIALLATTTPAAHSAVASILWEEVVL